MSTKKNGKKIVSKSTKPAVVEKDKKSPEAPVTEKITKKDDEVAEVVETTEVTEVATETVKETEQKEIPVSKKNTVIVPEVIVDDKKEDKKPTKVAINSSIGEHLASLGDPKDRIDKNRQIDLMGMIYKEYVSNPVTDNQLGKVAKQQFDAMAMISLIQYNAQVATDFQALGIKCDVKNAPVIERMAMELLGVKVTSLPSPDDPKQLMLQFESIPEEVTRTVIQEKKIEKTPIPEANPEMKEDKKIEAIQNIFQQKGEKMSMGNNLLTGIEWARKAFSFSEEEKKSVIFASLLSKGFSSTLINCFRNMVFGKINGEHSILGAHALMKAWCPSLKEIEIAEITQVLASCGYEKKIKDWNERAGETRQSNPENEFTLLNRMLSAANAEKVITGILESKEDVVIDYSDGLGNFTVHPRNIRNTIVAAYGDSANLLKDKLKEVVKYYATPIARLSSYVDKSAYSQK